MPNSQSIRVSKRRRRFMRELRAVAAPVSADESRAIIEECDYFIVGMTNSALPAESGQRLVTVFNRV